MADRSKKLNFADADEEVTGSDIEIAKNVSGSKNGVLGSSKFFRFNKKSKTLDEESLKKLDDYRTNGFIIDGFSVFDIALLKDKFTVYYKTDDSRPMKDVVNYEDIKNSVFVDNSDDTLFIMSDGVKKTMGRVLNEDDLEPFLLAYSVSFLDKRKRSEPVSEENSREDNMSSNTNSCVIDSKDPPLSGTANMDEETKTIKQPILRMDRVSGNKTFYKEEVIHESIEPVEPVVESETVTEKEQIQEKKEESKPVQKEVKLESNDEEKPETLVVAGLKKPKEIVVKIDEDLAYDSSVSTDFSVDEQDLGKVSEEDDTAFWSNVDEKIFGSSMDNGSGNIDIEENFEEVGKDEDIVVEYDNTENQDGDQKVDNDKLIEMNKMIEERNRERFNGYENPDDCLMTMMRSKQSRYVNSMRKTIDLENLKVEQISPDIMSATSFLTNSIEPLLKPDVVAVPLLISGIVVNISAFMYNDLSRVRHLIPEIRNVRDMAARNKALVEKRRLEIEIIYNHIVCVKGMNRRPTYDEFVDMVLFSDLPQLFFGAFVASHSNEHMYTVTCSSCGHEMSVSRTPKQLCEIVSKNIDIETVKQVLNGTCSKDKMAELDIVKFSKKVYSEKEPLPVSGLVLRTKIPTLREYLEAIDVLTSVYNESDVNEVDFLSLYYTRTLDDSDIETPQDFFRRACLYIHEMAVPTFKTEGDKVLTKFVSTKDKRIIYETLTRLHKDDIKAIIDSENIRRMMSVKGIQHFIKLDECPNCHLKMEPFPFNAELIFFLEELE